MPDGWTPKHQRVLDRNTERFGASNGDRVISDLLRDYSPEIVSAACDYHYDNNGGALDVRMLRGVCQRMKRGEWKMPTTGKGRSGPVAMAAPNPILPYVPPVPTAPGPKLDPKGIAAAIEAGYVAGKRGAS